MLLIPKTTSNFYIVVIVTLSDIHANNKNASVYTRVMGANPVIKNMLIPMRILKKITFNTSTSSLRASSSYKYEDALFHTQGKGFLGFLKTIVSESVSGIQTTATNKLETSRMVLYPENTVTQTISYVKKGAWCTNLPASITSTRSDGSGSFSRMDGRVYDPMLGMFLSPDPFIQAPDNWVNYNRYAYAKGNPLKYTDPDGENPAIAIAIGAIIGGVSNVIANHNRINDFWDFFAYGVKQLVV